MMMMADAFSMFDYGGGMSLTSLLSWVSTSIMLIFLLCSVDGWMIGNRLTIIFNFVGKLMGNDILGNSRVIHGFGLFCASLFIYLSFVGIFSIFPYTFCLTAHFSHNFSISMVLWFAALITNLSINFRSFGAHFVPGGLVWYQAAPVAIFEMISNISRLITLGARLTMNMIAGKLLLCVGSAFFGSMILGGMIFSIGGMCFTLLLLALTSWEMIVGVIQAYIFTFLNVTYVDELPVEVA